MLRSLYSGISGMKANQTKLDVIGNNISNVGTTAFKANRVKFQDLLSQSVNVAMAPMENQGGVNPSQVGMGVQIAGIDTIAKQGNMQPTSRNLDMAIDGEGYFIVGKGPTVFDNKITVNNTAGNHNIDGNSLTNSGIDAMYTRDGAFGLDNDGNLVTSNGYRVLGYSMISTRGVTSAGGNSFTIDAGAENADKGVLGIEFKLGASESASFNADGTILTLTLSNTKNNYTALDIQNLIKKSTNNVRDYDLSKFSVIANGTDKIDIDSITKTGAIIGGDNEFTFDIGDENIGKGDLTIKFTTTTGNSVSGQFSNDGKTIILSLGSSGTYKASDILTAIKGASGTNNTGLDLEEITLTPNGLDEIDPSKATNDIKLISPLKSMYIGTNSIDSDGNIHFVDATTELKAQDTSLKTLRIPDTVIKNGEAMRLISFSVSADGTISGILEDGSATSLGQIAMASFKNPEGLTKLGKNLYSASANSGNATIKTGVNTAGDDNSKGYGDILQGVLEMSNVDLAEQFTEMIVTSRAFQANGKVITTGDEILQDILNLKR
ncbi:flagellar hook protein FlgE [Clostridium sp. USBA 49]|uniref:flagellar hook protein FlgE n=1 Tax=Clostridium sp. USBA 49 TaxID=1881060 RepID=UPI00099A4506|nr:flagellar hook-basal body complex protein [Clostridium sp. USBA 49]SKA72669.1 flagellar hook protein FlgE [Clostridium sp. USBA 49]